MNKNKKNYLIIFLLISIFVIIYLFTISIKTFIRDNSTKEKINIIREKIVYPNNNKIFAYYEMPEAVGAVGDYVVVINISDGQSIEQVAVLTDPKKTDKSFWGADMSWENNTLVIGCSISDVSVLNKQQVTISSEKINIDLRCKEKEYKNLTLAEAFAPDIQNIKDIKITPKTIISFFIKMLNVFN